MRKSTIIAGLTAALRLTRAGKSVTLTTKGPGGLQLSQGTVDILGVGRGAVVPEDNPYAFALAVADLLRDPARRHALSADGRAYASEWSDTALAGRMAELYRDIIRAHGGMSESAAHDYKRELVATKRYVRDVY